MTNEPKKKPMHTSKIILEEIKVKHTYTYKHLQYLYAKMYICIKCTCEYCSLYILYILDWLEWSRILEEGGEGLISNTADSTAIIILVWVHLISTWEHWECWPIIDYYYVLPRNWDPSNWTRKGFSLRALFIIRGSE